MAGGFHSTRPLYQSVALVARVTSKLPSALQRDEKSLVKRGVRKKRDASTKQKEKLEIEFQRRKQTMTNESHLL